MIHLAVAVQLGAQDERCVSPDFLLGSIAPDSIHMRPGMTRADKETTHLVPLGERIAPDEAVRKLVQSHHGDDAGRARFALGYAAHILTDMLWMREIVDDLSVRIPPDVQADQQQHIALYYGECDQLDFNLYHQAPWRPAIWQKLTQARAPAFSPGLAPARLTSGASAPCAGSPISRRNRGSSHSISPMRWRRILSAQRQTMSKAFSGYGA
jgi:hypothetical protein